MERPRISIPKEQENNDGVIKGRDTDLLPLEIWFLIFLRLPVKALARCVCVSKLWASIIRTQGFNKSFHSQTTSQSRILFFVRDYYQTRYENWFFSSDDQEGKSSFLSSTTCHVSDSRARSRQAQAVNGLICCGYGRNPVIYNPSTGKSLTLPEISVGNNVGPYLENMLGFDPISAQYKVLSMTPFPGNHSQDSIIPYREHKVFTLGAQGSWRTVHCNISHCPGTISICINGVLYYGAYTGERLKECSLVRFDVRTEKFSFTEMPESVQSLSCYASTLVNYHGKIALAYRYGYYYSTYELWILEDAERNAWSSMSFSTSSWTDTDCNTDFNNIVGVTRMGEIILTSSYSYQKEFYDVYYYSLVTRQFRKIEIEGFKSPGGVVISWEYVENTTTMLL